MSLIFPGDMDMNEVGPFTALIASQGPSGKACKKNKFNRS